MREVRRIVDWMIVDLDHHISGTESSLFPPTAFFHRAHQYAIPAFDSKKLAQLGSYVFYRQPAACRLVDDDHRDRDVEVRHRGPLRHLRHLNINRRFSRHPPTPVRAFHLRPLSVPASVMPEV